VESKAEARGEYLDSIEPKAGPVRRFEIEEEKKVLGIIEEKADKYYADLSRLKLDLESIKKKAGSAGAPIRPRPRRLTASEIIDKHFLESKPKPPSEEKKRHSGETKDPSGEKKRHSGETKDPSGEKKRHSGGNPAPSGPREAGK